MQLSIALATRILFDLGASTILIALALFLPFLPRLFHRPVSWRITNDGTTGSTAKDEAEEGVGQLSQEHIDRIASRRWKEVLAWIVFHPDELRWLDKKRQTALHHACLFRAPAQIIEMILYQAPELATIANRDRELPLHWAVRLSCPNEVLKWLLTVNPASGCTAKDKDGNTALSMVWERHEEDLMEFWWNGGRDKIAEDKSWKQILYYLQWYSFSLTREGMRGSLCSNDSSVDDEELRQAQFQDHQRTIQPLHVVARCPGTPPSLFTLVILLYQSHLSQRDAEGRLPLAVACLDPISNRSVGALTKAHLLLTEYPAAASVTDYSGRLPIFTALDAGLILEEGIDRLMSFNPKMLLLRDPVTSLPPFLLAAAGAARRARLLVNGKNENDGGGGGGDDDKDEGDQTEAQNLSEARSLSTIYSLLRSDPSQLNNKKED